MPDSPVKHDENLKSSKLVCNLTEHSQCEVVRWSDYTNMLRYHMYQLSAAIISHLKRLGQLVV